MFFTDAPFEERFRLAKEAGFNYIWRRASITKGIRFVLTLTWTTFIW